jgi:mannose-6-phosphate isomerase
MKSKQENVAASLSKLIARLVETKADDSVSQLLVRLDREYPGGDVGVFSSLFLNHVFLQPGEAIFLAANEPHAYLSGGNFFFLIKTNAGKIKTWILNSIIILLFLDLVECMATSDNVVRAGLTPKFKDVDVLISMLTYRYGSADSQKMTPVKMGDHTLLYDPPIEEFSVALTKMEVNQTETHELLAGPSIIIATSGSGTLIGDDGKEHALDEGYIYFVGANTTLTAKTIDSNLQFYRAFTIPTQ